MKKVENIPQQKWTIKKCNRDFMRNNGFKYYHFDDAYVSIFPMYVKKNSGKFICRIIVYADTKDVRVDLYKEVEGNYYPQFYYMTNKGYAEFIDQINNVIYGKFDALGIHKKRRNKR